MPPPPAEKEIEFSVDRQGEETILRADFSNSAFVPSVEDQPVYLQPVGLNPGPMDGAFSRPTLVSSAKWRVRLASLAGGFGQGEWNALSTNS